MVASTMLRRGRLLALSWVLFAGLAVSACGGEDEPEAEPSPTPTTASPTPTPTETRPPTKPEVDEPTLPAFRKGEAGQEAFATYVVQAWAYALATNDADPLVGLSVGRKQACRGCPELITELKERTAEGWSVYPFEVAIEGIRLIESALGVTARVSFDVPETRSFFDDGSFRNDSAAHDDSTFTISMRPEKQEYRLIGFTISQD